VLFRGLFRSWQALSWPPSHCPKCDKQLKWYDNLPVVGWLKLGGRCRFCKQPISIRYPIIEGLVGLLFVFYYIMFFIVGHGPCLHRTTPDDILQFYPASLIITEHWPTYVLDMMLLAGLLAASLIDAELFIIPIEIPWFIVPFALIEHAVFDRPGWPGALNCSGATSALAAGAGIGVGISFALWYIGILPTSFAEGGPLLDVDRTKLAKEGKPDEKGPEFTPRQIRAEMRKEMLFLLPPLMLGLAWVMLTWKVQPIGRVWTSALACGWFSGLLGSILGLLMGGFVVWLTRILGSLAFGREAMGMGDVHLMVAVGAVLGAGPATIAFFLAPFFGMLLVLYMVIMRKGRELPYGPYLSLATAFVMLFYCPIADYLSPGIAGLVYILPRAFCGG